MQIKESSPGKPATKRLMMLLPRTWGRRADGTTSLAGVLVGGVAATASSAIVARLLSTVTQIMIARQLGVLVFGQYSTIMATLGLLASFLGLGFDTWILREGGRSPASLAQSVWQVLMIKAVGAIALLAVLSVFWSNRGVLSWPLLIGVPGIILDSFGQTGFAVLRATRRNVEVAVYQTLEPLLLLAMLLLLRVTILNLLLIIGVQVLASLVIVVALMRNIWHVVGIHERRFRPSAVLRGAGLFVVADILSNIYSQSGVVILGYLVGSAAVGLYRPAVSTITATYMIPNLIFLVGLPLISAPDLTRQARRTLIGLMAGGGLLYGLVVLLGMAVGGRPLLQLLYGRDFAEALPLLQKIAYLPLVKTGSFVCVAVLLAYNQQRLRVIIQSAVMLISVVGGLIIIPRGGAVGAIWLYGAVETLLFGLYLVGAIVVSRRSHA